MRPGPDFGTPKKRELTLVEISEVQKIPGIIFAGPGGPTEHQRHSEWHRTRLVVVRKIHAVENQTADS